RFPKHVAVILDGHRRYARSEGLASYTDSYRAGMRRFEDFLDWNSELGIEAITGWLLSRENLDRPEAELAPYFEVLIELFDRLPARCATGDMAVRFIGSLDLLPDTVVKAAKRAEEARPTGSRWLTIALGYGGRQEIVDAARDLVASLLSEDVPVDEIPDRITADSLAGRIDPAHVPS